MQKPMPISIFLWQMPEALLGNVRSAFMDGLGSADKQRYLTMVSSKRRAEFLAGRLLLRHALRHCYGDASERWQLVAPAEMGICLKGFDINDHPPSVSISHSSGLVVCAVADLPRLGVDVENYHARKTDVSDLAGATLHSSELAEMEGVSAVECRHYFFRRWTLKEALAKALGIGLALPFREFSFIEHQLANSPEDWCAKGEHWGFANMDIGTNTALGLAWTTKHNDSVVTLQVIRPKSLVAGW
jgi:4'-phosphopantetheinyl transferase